MILRPFGLSFGDFLRTPVFQNMGMHAGIMVSMGIVAGTGGE
jgi:uncharacterized membrane-anchored protein